VASLASWSSIFASRWPDRKKGRCSHNEFNERGDGTTNDDLHVVRLLQQKRFQPEAWIFMTETAFLMALDVDDTHSIFLVFSILLDEKSSTRILHLAWYISLLTIVCLLMANPIARNDVVSRAQMSSNFGLPLAPVWCHMRLTGRTNRAHYPPATIHLSLWSSHS
jgi:hypothetical protein